MRRVGFAVLGLVLLGARAASAEAPVRLFAMTGQSNMTGYGDVAVLDDALEMQTAVLYDHFNAETRVNEPAYVGTTSTDWGPLSPQGTNHRYGPEITFGDAIARARPTEQAAILKASMPGSNLVEHWGRGLPLDPKYPEKSQMYHALFGALDSATYDALQWPDEPTRLDHAIQRLEAAGRTWSWGCFVYVQGENEAFWSGAFQYEARLRELVAAVREDAGDPALPFVIARVGMQLAGMDPPNLEVVRQAQVAVAESTPGMAWIDTDDLPPRGDGFHFDSIGYQTMGTRLAEACLALMPPPVEDPSTTSSTSGATGSGDATSGSSGETGASTGGASDDGEGGGSNGGDGADASCGCRIDEGGASRGGLALVLGAVMVGAARLRRSRR